MDPLARKRQENIAGYIISMWHLEDLLRASRFDLKVIEQHLIGPMDDDPEAQEELREWYRDLVERMHEEGVERQGHLSEVEEVLGELETLHRSLTEVLNDEEYAALYAQALPGITTLQQQAGEEALPPIETCFTAVYGVMVLRAQNKEVAPATLEAERHMRRLLERLADHYRNMHRLPGVSLN
jgi:hypothetical protein